MAYMNFAEPDAASLFRPNPVAKVAPAPTLSALEWTVVALARRDSLSSLRTPGPIARAMAVVFGTAPENPIADPRLEALRRMAVYGWHRSFSVPPSEIDRFCEAGFSAGQLELLLTSISRDRASRGQRSA